MDQDARQKYQKSIKQKIKKESLYDVESWYDSIKEYTFETKFMEFTVEEGLAIRKYYRNKFCSGPTLIDNEIKILQNLQNKMDSFIQKEFPNQDLFVRLSTRSPKDCCQYFEKSEVFQDYLQKMIAQLKNMGITKVILNERIEKYKKEKNLQTNKLHAEEWIELINNKEANNLLTFLMNTSKDQLKIKTGQQIMDLFYNSERTFIDIYHLLISKGIEDSTTITEAQSKKSICNVVFRKWYTIHDENEFRCFFYNKQLTAISQYNYYIYSEELNTNEKQEQIKKLISNKFEELKNRLSVENGVIDFALEGDKTWVVELNPFNDYEGGGTGGALFHWKQDWDILTKGPLELRVVEELGQNISQRISIFGAEKLLVQSLINITNEEPQKNNCLIQ